MPFAKILQPGKGNTVTEKLNLQNCYKIILFSVVLSTRIYLHFLKFKIFKVIIFIKERCLTTSPDIYRSMWKHAHDLAPQMNRPEKRLNCLAPGMLTVCDGKNL